MRFFKIIVNWTPKIWLPLAIVLLNGVINFSWKLYFLVYLDLYGLDLLKGTHTKVFSGFFTIAGALIDWILISVLLFLGCQLLYNGKGVFRNFLLINIASHICFVLILVPVVQTFFQIRWVQALCNVCISYAIYWALNKALWYIFPHVLLFFFPEFLGPRWQPGDPISP